MIWNVEDAVEGTVSQVLTTLGERPEPDRWAFLQCLARLTALKQAPDGTFHLGHWWRGPLLYTLVQRSRPRHILEFGTGRGYGALCMAQASVDGGFDCTVWTIDRIPPTHVQPWAIDEGDAPLVVQRSLEQVWSAHVPADLTQRIRCLTGDSRAVMQRWERAGHPRIDFCFIDGGHDYSSVKHDLLAVCQVANPGCSILFDDYTERRGYGVKRLIDREIAQRVPGDTLDVIDTLAQDRTVCGEVVPHKMVLIRGDRLGRAALPQLYSPGAVRWFFGQDAVRCATASLVSRVRGLGRRVVRRTG